MGVTHREITLQVGAIAYRGTYVVVDNTVIVSTAVSSKAAPGEFEPTYLHLENREAV